MSDLIRVGLLDFDADVRFGTRMIVESNPRLRVFFESDGKNEDVQTAAETLIDVLIVNHRLSMGSGIDFYEQLRELTGLKEAPSAVLTTAFEQPDLQLAAFRSGFFDIVSLEAGPETLFSKALEAAEGKRSTTLAKLGGLIRQANPQKELDIPLNQLVSSLPEKYQSNLRRLRTIWQKTISGKDTATDLTDFSGLFSKLGTQTPEEAIVRLYLAGHLDEQ